MRLYDLHRDTRLRSEFPRRERAIRELSWVQDGIGDSELDGVQALVNLGWYGNGDTFDTIMSKPWVKDELNKHEVRIIYLLRRIAWQSRDAAHAISVMPFLDTVEPPDVLAMESLRRLGYFGEEGILEPLLAVLQHPTIADGITDEETPVVATLYSTANYKPDVIDALLDPETVLLENRVIDLPLAGPANLTIIRTQPGPAVTMDLLEDAVRHVERFMSLPFPVRQVNYLFADVRPGRSAGANSGTHITSRPYVDGTDYVKNETETSYVGESTHRHFIHETGHYYWRGNPSWLDEGAVAFIEAIARSRMSGRPLSLEYEPCAQARNIAKLERMRAERKEVSSRCDAGLGERLFHDLYRNMDDTTFRLAFRRLYLLSQFDDPNDDCEGTRLGICHVRASFTTDVPDEAAATALKVINRWYGSSEP